ncbi:hypothetical protein Droror1_Dr00002047 [Drosera rotundifolia]
MNPYRGLPSCPLHHLDATNRSSNKKLRLAFTAVYFTRLLCSLRRKLVISKGEILRSLARSPSYIVLNVGEYYDDHQHQPKDVRDHDTPIFSINPNALTHIVREKDLEGLAQVGGVQGLTPALWTNEEAGVVGNPTLLAQRRDVFGVNKYHRPPKKGFMGFVIEAFKDTTIIILLLCAVLSLGFGIKQHGPKEGWCDGGSIIMAVFLVVVVSSISNFKQCRQFGRLSDQSGDIRVEVIRDGRRQHTSIFDVVVGDVVRLKIGDQIPADGLLVSGHSLKVDESSMTGESDHVEINDNTKPFLLSGTKVMDGYGTMLVTAVGMNTVWGEMMSSVSRDLDEETPLQGRLTKLTSYIGKVGLLVAALVLMVLLIRYFTGHINDESGTMKFIRGKTSSDQVINAVVNIVSAAVTIIVVAIPEGLPLAVTLTLAYSMKRMMADNAMVRKLSACETMGSATTICTDKTGTLTLNQMKVTEFWLGKDTVVGQTLPLDVAANVRELFQEGAGLNTTGSVCRLSPALEPEISGSPTEKAILSWAHLELGMDMDELKRTREILHVEAFNSEKKRSLVLVKRSTTSSRHVHWKGAAEMILAMCSKYHDRAGMLKLMDDEVKSQFMEIIQNMAAKSLRCIAFAHKQLTEETQEDKGNLLDENGLTLLGILGLKDPCRPGVQEAVESCRRAGVNVKMITGDNVYTAKAIAKECGILKAGKDTSDESVVEGIVFRNYSDEERMAKVDNIRVMARSSPFDKLLMVQCLKQKGHVVAVTGDGTNDAPALKEADIGLSMGIQGTEVAKESSDIVILDDNFASVVTVLRWGRCVYSNIQKFIQFQLTVNIAALIINFVAAVSSGDVPLTAVQLLWVNLIMDTLGALALATEEPTRDLMQNPPVGRTKALITKVMWRNLIAQALYQTTVLLTIQFKGRSIFGVDESIKNTIIFNCFVLCQVFNEFNARKLEKKNVFEGVLKNKLFMAIVGITVLLQMIMVEFLKRFANTERLNLAQWGVCIAIAALSWPIGWLVKCIPVERMQQLGVHRT